MFPPIISKDRPIKTHHSRKRTQTPGISYPFPPYLFQMIKTWLINMKWPQGFLLFSVDSARRRSREHASGTGSVGTSFSLRLYTTRRVDPEQTDPQKHRRTHPFSSFTLTAEHPEKCYYHTKAHRLVIIISLSYITSFLQHKNRSITMITIFLNVNIQYLLRFQINLFLIHLVVVIFTPPKKQTRSTGTHEWQRTGVRHDQQGALQHWESCS